MPVATALPSRGVRIGRDALAINAEGNRRASVWVAPGTDVSGLTLLNQGDTLATIRRDRPYFIADMRNKSVACAVRSFIDLYLDMVGDNRLATKRMAHSQPVSYGEQAAKKHEPARETHDNPEEDRQSRHSKVLWNKAHTQKAYAHSKTQYDGKVENGSSPYVRYSFDIFV